MTKWEKGELTGLPMGFEIADTDKDPVNDKKAADKLYKQALADEKAGKKYQSTPEEWGLTEWPK